MVDYSLLIKILFDKEAQEQFFKECEELGIKSEEYEKNGFRGGKIYKED